MLDSLFSGLFTSASGTITLGNFCLSIASALVLGAVLVWIYGYRNTYTKSFAVTLALLPAIVSVIIMMVSGSLGAGVAVAGTFSLVRFRSAPGTAKEICAIFLAMAVGLACGMGYPAFAALCARTGQVEHVNDYGGFGEIAAICREAMIPLGYDPAG